MVVSKEAGVPLAAEIALAPSVIISGTSEDIEDFLRKTGVLRQSAVDAATMALDVRNCLRLLARTVIVFPPGSSTCPATTATACACKVSAMHDQWEHTVFADAMWKLPGAAHLDPLPAGRAGGRPAGRGPRQIAQQRGRNGQ